jgi:hypothetical protein
MLYIPRASWSSGLGFRAPFGDVETWVQIPPRHRPDAEDGVAPSYSRSRR